MLWPLVTYKLAYQVILVTRVGVTNVDKLVVTNGGIVTIRTVVVTNHHGNYILNSIDIEVAVTVVTTVSRSLDLGN